MSASQPQTVETPEHPPEQPAAVTGALSAESRQVFPLPIVHELLARLITAGLLDVDTRSRRARIADAVGVTPAAVAYAAGMADGRRSRPDAASTVDTGKPARPSKGGGRPRRQRETPYGRELWCVNGEHWAPEAAFAVRSDRPSGARRSSCRDCANARQRDRYLSVGALDEMDRVGIRFEVLDGDSLVGIVCIECGQLIDAGDAVAMHGFAVHAGCAEDDDTERDDDDDDTRDRTG